MRPLLTIVVIGCATPTSSLEESATAPVVLSSTTPATLAFNFGNNLAVDGRGRLHAVWTEGPASAVSVAYARSTNDGLTWSGPGHFGTTQVTTGSIPSVGARVAAAGDDVYITWVGSYEGYPRIYAIASRDAGASFAGPFPISDAKIATSYPSIAAFGHTVAIVWTDDRTDHNEIYLRVSTDDGATFRATIPVSTTDHISSWTPAVAVAGSDIHVAWTDERNDLVDCATGTPCREEEYYRHSPDNGTTWGAEQRLTFDPAGAPKSSWAPSIAAVGSTVHLAYFDIRSGLWRIYYRRSLDRGTTWGTERVISDPTDTVPSWRPVLSALGTQARMVFWRGGYASGPSDVYIAGSTDSGATWAPPVRLTQNLGATTFAASQPQIVFAPTGANHVLWMDDRSGATQIFYGRY